MSTMRLEKEKQILDEEFRLCVIEAIESPENQARRGESFKRYEVYKDRVNLYVESLMILQFDAATVDEMRYAISNISIFRKVINKLARVYSNGVERKLGSKEKNKQLEEAEKLFKFDAKMKKANRYLRAFKNTLVMPKPFPINEDKTEWDIRLRVFPPYLYDVIEDVHDPETAKVYIFSDFNINEAMPRHSLDARHEGRTRGTTQNRLPINSQREPDGKNQTTADHPLDVDPNKRFIWWSKNFHFVTNGKGEIVERSDGSKNTENPIKRLPCVTLAEDQDGEYWALGGDDLIDGSILINSMITNTNHIGVTQGYGQAVMIGSGLPKKVKIGPNFIIRLETKEGQTIAPDFKYQAPGAPLDDLRQQTVMYIALLLSMNNLSTSGVKTDLGKGFDFPSGVAMMIDKSESLEDVEDQEQVFLDTEPEIWELVFAWIEDLKNRKMLAKRLQKITLKPEQAKNIAIHFNDAPQLLSEKEKLENIQTRKDLGINLMIELLQKDDSSLTDEMAAEKLLKITAEQLKLMQARVINGEEPVKRDDQGNEISREPSKDGSKGGFPPKPKDSTKSKS